MPELRGTRVYWKNSDPNGGSVPVQILKNSGYINVVLQAVQYKATGNWWQQTFGGSDKITVSTQVTWESGSTPKVAAAIQDFRKVSVPSVNSLAIGRNIVLKVPAAADGIELQVSISAVSDDGLGRTLQLLNSDEFKQPLQLAPVVVGQALMIANLVKKVFTNTDPSEVLTASYPGIISDENTANPVANSRLVQGYIIVIVKQDDDDQLDFNPDKLTVTGNGLLSDGRPIANTYMVYNVTFDKWRGRDTSAAWSKKFDQASTKADELVFSMPDQKQNIISAAYDLLKAGSALLDIDESYTSDEKARLKRAALQELKDKISDNTGGDKPEVRSEAIRGATLATSILVKDAEDQTDFHKEVSEYAHQLAAKGLTFGFSFKPQL